MKRIKHTTDQLIARWKNREFTIKHVEIWTRAAQGSSAAVAKAAVGGICHTFLLIETGPSTFLLERLVEGVRFVTLDDETVEQNKKWAKRMYLADDIAISSKDIAKWIEEKQASSYNLLANNCIHFAYQFGVHFKFAAYLFQAGFMHFLGRAQKELPAKKEE